MWADQLSSKLGLEHSSPLSRLRGNSPDVSWLQSTARTGGGRSGSFRGVKTVLLRRREKRGESRLQVFPYLLFVSHTRRCTLDRSRLSAPTEFLWSTEDNLLFSYSIYLSQSSIAGVEVKRVVRWKVFLRRRGRVTWLSLFWRAEWSYLLHWMYVTFKCTSRWVHFTLSARHIECKSRLKHVTSNVRDTTCTLHWMYVS